MANASPGATMRFFFDIQTGDTVVADAEGIKFTSSEEAHHQAVLATREMMAKRLPWGGNRWEVTVVLSVATAVAASSRICNSATPSQWSDNRPDAV